VLIQRATPFPTATEFFKMPPVSLCSHHVQDIMWKLSHLEHQYIFFKFFEGAGPLRITGNAGTVLRGWRLVIGLVVLTLEFYYNDTASTVGRTRF